MTITSLTASLRSNVSLRGGVSAIVMKLLAKRAEDRYQTAAGLESDLRRCQTAWEARRAARD
jgi:hypothetical protein